MVHRRHRGWGHRSAWVAGLLVVLLAALGGPALAEAANSGFVRASNGQFVLNGQPFRFASTNGYFFVDAGSDGSARHTDDMLALAADHGFRVIRSWAFMDGTSAGRGLQPSAGVYDEQAFRALDYALYKADLANIRLVLALVNWWSDYGGMPQYLQWCAPGQGINAFYTNASCKQIYKNYVSYVLNRVNTYNGRRYKDDPTIFGWELANEPRSDDPSGGVITQWFAEMGAYVKSIDPNHIVGTGEEGFDTTTSGYGALTEYNNQAWLFNGGVGVSFTNNTALPQIDFASIHVYPDVWNLPAHAGATWIRDHARKARQMGKPLLIGEFGWPQSPWSILKPWMDTFEAEQIGGALIWQMICNTVCGNYGGVYTTVYPPNSQVSAGMAQVAATAHESSGGTPPPPAPPPPPPPGAADFTLSATANPSPVAPGQPVTIASQVTASAAAPGLNVNLEVYDEANARVGQRIYSGQSFSAGTPRSYSWSWPGTPTPGAYIVKMGVFSADWNTLHEWNNQAATISVQSGASAPTDFTLSASVSPSQVAPGQAATVSAQAQAIAPASNVTVLLEIYAAGDVKIAERIYTGQNFASAGTTRSYSWTWPGTPTPGAYTVKMGAFSADWATLYEWNNAAASLVIDAAAVVLRSTDFTHSTRAVPSPIRPGEVVTVTSQVTARKAVTNLQVDLEIFDPAGVRVAQRLCTLTFAAQETKPCTWSNPGQLAPGTYTVKLGIFSSDWGTRYRWYSRATTFRVRP